MPEPIKRIFRNKHYFAIAKIILSASLKCQTPNDHEKLHGIARAFVDLFEKELPGFDGKRFFSLCGLNANIVPLAPKNVL